MQTDKRLSIQDIENVGTDHEFGGFPMREMVGYDGTNLQRINASNLDIQIERDGQGNPIYLGLAAPGTSTSSALWQIRKLTFDGQNNLTAMQYSYGSSEFESIWDDRAILDYS